MPSEYLIYALVDPRTSAVRYIGKSSSGLQRPKAHLYSGYLRAATHKNNWLKQLLAEGLKPEIRVLEKFDSPKLLNLAERLWIAQARQVGWPLTNTTKGGDGTFGRKASDRLKASLARANKAREWTQEQREHHSRAMTGRTWDEARKAAFAESKRGRPPPMTAEDRARGSETMKRKFGKPFKDQHGRVYQTLSEAAKALDMNKSGISHVLNGRAKQMRGYVFTYLKSDE